MIMARAKPGRPQTAIWSKVIRITLHPEHAALQPFFEWLMRLPPGERNDALLDAIKSGTGQVEAELNRPESRKASSALDALLEDL